jgi:hypothetical protein
MLQRVRKSVQGKYLLVAGLTAIAAVVGLTVIPSTSASAAREHCRVFTPTTFQYEGGRRMTTGGTLSDPTTRQPFTVPNAANSDCDDINIRNVKDQNPAVPSTNPEKYCARFLAVMFPSNGSEPIYTTPKKVCSKGPNGPVVPIVTNVLNGTKYRILYDIKSLEHRIEFQVVD